MPTVLADSFTAALARLTGEEQKQAKLTAFDLQTDPERPGLRFHRIEASKDPNFWSVRVNRDLRIIVHKTGASLLLAFVGHHDPAYRWAERRRIEAHPKTGVLQIVEVRERVEEIAVRVPVPEPEPALPPIFAGLDGDQLLSVGVPEDWLDDVLGADEDRFLELAEHLPPEAAEALLNYISSGTLAVPPLLAVPEHALPDPLAHPDTRRRFRVIENLEELEAALAYPWEKWVVFLHPDQRGLVEHDYAGPVRIAGSAGTGKTVVALHRTMRTLREDADNRVLLTTFSDPLARALRAKLRVLAGGEAHLLDRLSLASFRGVAEELHELVFARKPHLAKRELIRSLVAKARAEAGLNSLTEQFVLSEWFTVVDAWQLPDQEAYAQVPRMGRRTRLGARQREALWPVFETVRRQLAERHLLTPAMLFDRLTQHFAAQERKPFTQIVVDEAQDLGVAELRFLSAIAPQDPQALFFAGDLGQRIFQPPFSWSGLGIDVRGRSFTLRVNYRTSHQIRSAADRLLPANLRDVDGLEDQRGQTVSVFNGPQPEILVAENEAQEAERVAAFLRQALDDGIEPAAIGLFVRSRAQLPRARAALSEAGLEATQLTGSNEGEAGRVALGTMHFAKGLEFRAVAVMACDEAVIPDADRLADVADEMELDEVYATERQLLYVAATRARDRLLVSGVEPASEFLDDLGS